MGEAKAKRKLLKERISQSRSLTFARFNVFAIGTRLSMATIMADEISYWSDLEERVIGFVFRDTTDNDFGWSLLARDKIGRFRWVDGDVSLRSPDYATTALRERIAIAVEDGDFSALGDQDDETNYPIDLLSPPHGTDPSKLHRFFRALIEDPGRAPARAILKEIGPWLAPSDPHFVREFQFNQFDQRLWELYLWATFRELGFDISQPEAPDFLCSAPGVAFTVEATTVAPSTSGALADRPDPKTPEELQEFLQNYMPMKFGSALTSKLNKKNKDGESYWERGETAGKPFILAIADFHVPGDIGEVGSMTYTQSALWPYLYGHRVGWEFDDGKLQVHATKGSDHAYNGKTVPTGFFDLDGSENVSAVLFSNAGTLAKFDRMGVAAGFAPPKHTYLRMGLRFNPYPNSVIGTPFSADVSKSDYREAWSDELQLFHNPNAKYPLDRRVFPGVTHHYFKDGDHHTISTDHAVLASRTLILRTVDGGADEQVSV